MEGIMSELDKELQTEVNKMWGRINNAHKHRNIPKANITKDEFVDWVYSAGLRAKYKKYISSGYDKDMKPSVDRIDSHVTYQLGNLRLITLAKNQALNYSDRRQGKGRSGLHNKKIKSVNIKTGKVTTYVSESEASRKTGVNRGNIVSACKGKLKRAGEYTWSYSKESVAIPFYMTW